MTDLLAQFALHAPAVPDWYRATDEPECPPYPSPSANPDVSFESQMFRAWQTPEGKAQRAWEREVTRLRLASWPWHFARMVLDAKPETTEEAEYREAGEAIKAVAGKYTKVILTDGDGTEYVQPIIIPKAASTPYPSDD